VWLFVNGRAVRDRQLAHAVLRAYGEVMPHGRFPAALVFVEVPPAQVDVNVHPAKAEVRLADPRAAYEAISAGLRAVLATGAWLPLESGTAAVGPSRTYQLDRGASPEDAGRDAAVADALQRYGARAPYERPDFQLRSPSRDRDAALLDLRAAGERALRQGQLVAPEPYFAGLRYLGQLHRTYLVCEGPNGLVLIDQHAAHERMNYQRLRRAARERGAAVQPNLVPHVVQLAPATAALVAEGAEALAAIGIDIEPFGSGALAIKALPAPLASAPAGDLPALLSDLADELSSRGRGESFERLQDALLARAACHASVRAHDALSEGEARALLAALDATDYGARCAHGRPVVAEWDVAEIEKRFGRDYESYPHTAPADAL
jgi:DNA mismatch repair protein MutL